MFETIYIKDKDGKRVTWVIGVRGVIFYVNQLGVEKAEEYHEAIEILNSHGLNVSRQYIMV